MVRGARLRRRGRGSRAGGGGLRSCARGRRTSRAGAKCMGGHCGQGRRAGDEEPRCEQMREESDASTRARRPARSLGRPGAGAETDETSDTPSRLTASRAPDAPDAPISGDTGPVVGGAAKGRADAAAGASPRAWGRCQSRSRHSRRRPSRPRSLCRRAGRPRRPHPSRPRRRLRIVRVIAGVVHCRASPPGDPVMVAVVVEEVIPGNAAGALDALVVPQFGAAGSLGVVARGRPREVARAPEPP